jgi:hypothetical protein
MRQGGVFELCTQILANAAAVREATGVPVYVAEQRIYQANLQHLQAALGASAFEAAWRAGLEVPVLSLIEKLPA